MSAARRRLPARAAVVVAVAAAAALAVWVRVAPARLPADVAASYRTPAGEPLFYTPDAFYHLRLARELAATGRRGEPREDGAAWDPLSFAPAGRPVRASLLQDLEARVWRLWPGDASLTAVAFHLPAALAALSVLVGFWIGRRLAGTAGGLAAAALTALHPEMVSHTHSGMADTTAPALVLHALAAGAGLGLAGALWRVLDGARCRAGEAPGASPVRPTSPALWLAAAGWAALLGLALALAAATWAGWPAALLAAAAPAGAALAAALWRRAGTGARRALVAAGAIAAAAGAVALLLVSPAGRRLAGYAERGALGPFPNGAREVQELAAVEPGEAADRLGGWPAVGLAAAGVLWLALRAPRPAGPLGAVLLAAWALPAAAAGTRAMRFLVYAAPPVAVAAGCALAALAAAAIGRLARARRRGAEPAGRALPAGAPVLARPRSPEVAMLAVAAALAFAAPWSGRLEGFADRRPEERALAEAAAAIAARAPAGALVYSWWDRGHALAALSGRGVVLDGTSFQTPRLYWLSLALATSEETLAVNVLRLIGCGGEESLYWALARGGMPPARAAAAMRQALLYASPEDAVSHLRRAGAAADAVAEARRLLTCRPPPSWLVVGGDLTSKTYAWTWYGVWKFDRPNRPPGPRMTAPVPCRLTEAGGLACTDGLTADLARDGWDDRSTPGHFAAAGPPRPDSLVPVLHQQGDDLLLTYVRPWLVETLFARLYFFHGRRLERFRLEQVFHHPHTRPVLLYRVIWDED